MTPIREVIEWMERVLEKGGTEVWVDEGGLALECDNGGCFEIGGEPLDDESPISFGTVQNEENDSGNHHHHQT